jgi:phage tail sheath protein FI
VFIDDADSSFTDSIVESMQWAIQQYAGAPNNSNTWDAVIASLSGLLTQAWEAGSLWSPTSNQPYSVVCQPTPIMIMQSTMACNVSMQLADGSTFTTTVTQSMMSG